MKKELPKVYANKIEGEIKNNEKVYFSSNTNTKEKKTTNDTPSLIGKNINQKINTIFSSENYIYKANVEITLDNGNTITKKIIGRNHTHLITMENELIPISNITDIKYKKKD